MTTTNDLLDRMAEALRCWRQFPFTADKIEITDAALAEYDRLRASPSQEKAGGDERLGAFQIEMEKELCALVGRPWATSGFSIETLLADLRKKLSAHPTPEADAIRNAPDWSRKCAAIARATTAAASHPTPDADAMAPVAFGIRTDTGGWFDKIAPTGWTTFDYERSKMENEPWVIKGNATIEPLYARPAPTVATREAVSDAMVRALMVRLYPGVFQKTESERYDRMFPIVRKALEDALAAPPTVRAGDEG